MLSRKDVRTTGISGGCLVGALSGLLAVGFFGVLAGCEAPQPLNEPFAPPAADEPAYARPLPPGELALRRLDPSSYPDFSRAFNHRDGLVEAARQSLVYLSKPSSRRYFPYGVHTHRNVVESLERFIETVQEARSAAELDDLIRNRFDVYQSVGWDDRGTVFFTGYYTPIFEARLTRDSRFRYPLYRLPADLVKDVDGRTHGRRTADGRLVKYYSRAEIERDLLLAGTEIAWLSDPFEAYLVTIQGSAKLRLADGSQFSLAYAGNNGHEYASAGQAMIRDGLLSPNDMSVQAMQRVFRERPELVTQYCWQNPRTVFFTEGDGTPRGSLNVPVTARASLATDKSVFPRACVTFIETFVPSRSGEQVPVARFMFDQDTGGAIRAAGRADIYMGIGAAAGQIAGRTASEGRLYYLFAKDGFPSLMTD